MQRMSHNKKSLICAVSGGFAFLMLIFGLGNFGLGNDMLFGNMEYHENKNNTDQKWNEHRRMIQSYYYLLLGILMLYFSWKTIKFAYKVYKNPPYEDQYNGNNVYSGSYPNQLNPTNNIENQVEQGLSRYPYYNQPQQQLQSTGQSRYYVVPPYFNQNNGTNMVSNPTQLNQNNGTNTISNSGQPTQMNQLNQMNQNNVTNMVSNPNQTRSNYNQTIFDD